MKIGALLNSDLSFMISNMGHKDSLTIGDAGLPVPCNVKKIDLAVTKGVPGFLSVFDAVLSEHCIEMAIMAEEMKEISPVLHQEIVERIKAYELHNKKDIHIEYVSHEEFKKRTENSRAVVRTGEFTPYANIILVSGVVF